MQLPVEIIELDFNKIKEDIQAMAMWNMLLFLTPYAISSEARNDH